jgi:hypothetical protein
MHEPVQVKLGRFLWAGPLTIVVSVAAVLLIRTVAVTILKPGAKFLPLTAIIPISDTVVFTAFAVLALFFMARYSLEPIRDYRSLALKVLFVSFGPDIALATLHWFGGGWPEALALMAMHVAVWGICVMLLPALVTPNGRLPKRGGLPTV